MPTADLPKGEKQIGPNYILEGQKKFFHNMNQKRFPKIVIIITIIVFAGMGGYFALRGETGLKTGLKTILYPQTAVEPPQLKNETANWKTYFNDKFRFEFRYPESWFIQQEHDKLLESNRVIVYFGDQQQIDSEDYKISLDIQQVDSSFFIEHVRANKPVSVLEGTDVSNSIILVDGKEAVLQKFTYSEPSEGLLSKKTTSYEVVIPLGKNTIFIKSRATYKSTLDQILATFKFVK